MIWSGTGRLVVFLLFAALPGCRAPEPDARPEIRAALERYLQASRAMNADSIAAAFAPAGVLFEPGIPPIQSPESIRAFVVQFAGAVVESASVSIDTIEVSGASAHLWGGYFERLSFPGQPRSEQRGKLVMRWRRLDGRWLIDRYYRIPLSTAVPAH